MSLGFRAGPAWARREEGARPATRPARVDTRQAREADRPLRERGMTLHAICDVLNDEGVPTSRGGSLWRPASLRAVLA
jgi:hypothetical protein